MGAVLLSRALPGSLGGRAREQAGQSMDQTVWGRCSRRRSGRCSCGARDHGPGRAARAQRRAGREPAWGGERRLPAGATCSVHTGPPRNQPTTCTRRGPWSQALTDQSSLEWRCANMLLKTRSGVKSPLKPPAPGHRKPRVQAWRVVCGVWRVGAARSQAPVGIHWSSTREELRRPCSSQLEFVTLWGSLHFQQTGRHPNMS